MVGLRRLALALTVLLAGCGPSGSDGAAVEPTPEPTAVALVGRLTGYPDFAAVPKTLPLGLHREPADDAPVEWLSHGEHETPRTLLIRTEKPSTPDDEGWFEVLPPTDDVTTRWVRADDVTVVGLPYRLVVDVRRYRLDVYEGDDLIRAVTIGVSADANATPPGLHFVTELVRPLEPDPTYGPYLFGLSGGAAGLHGGEADLGQTSGRGGIRMRNDDIEYLAGLLPLGTPVEIIS